jgi:hypothetical protein
MFSKDPVYWSPYTNDLSVSPLSVRGKPAVRGKLAANRSHQPGGYIDDIPLVLSRSLSIIGAATILTHGNVFGFLLYGELYG